MRITKIDQKGVELICKFEGLRLHPYKCSAGIPTIGYGSTYYEDGSRVTMEDTHISKERAIELFQNVINHYEIHVDSFTRDDINQNMFNALVSFTFNVGIYALKNSTLLKKINKNPLEKSIKNEFMKWNKSNGKINPGLTRRREIEAKLYFNDYR